MFQDIFDDDIEISDLVEEYNNNIYDDNLFLNIKKNKKKWIVEFPYEIVYNYMKIQANSISKIINEINSKEDIKTIIFVGGYCSNEIIISLIKKNLNKINMCLQPSNPSLAIMEGAVLFGINPSIISVRKAKYTIGEEIDFVWNEEKHAGKGEKYFGKEANKYFCRDCFEKFIEIDQNLKYDEEISHIANAVGYVVVNKFYKTKKKNPTFVFEEGITKIGECTLYIDKQYENYDDREIKTIMKFGGTFIDVTAIHLKSGKSVKTTLTFD